MSIIKYQVIDIQTKQIIKEYASDKGKVARRFAEKKCLEYGAHRYYANPVIA